MCACNLLQHGAKYSGRNLHADRRVTHVTHGLGLMSIGVIITKKMNFFINEFQALQHITSRPAVGWTVGATWPI